MKLSRLTTDELAQVLCELTPPLCRIARDPRTIAAFDALSLEGLDTQPTLSAAAHVWETLLPLLLRDHAQDSYAVLAVLTEKSAETLRAQSGLATLRDLRDVWDGDLAAFFTSAGAAAQEKS